jgi:hypothetical protein
MLDQFPSAPALIMFRSALPAVLPNLGGPYLLVERLGGVVDRPGRDPALVVFRSALWAFAPWVGWPGRPAKVAGGLLRAEEGIQQAGVVRLRRNHLVL